MRKLPLGINNERRLKAMTGLDYEKFELLLDIFIIVYVEKKLESKEEKPRKRKEGGGRKPSLPTIEIMLLFVLFYLKSYPSFDVLGDRFSMATSTANKWLHKLMPILQIALSRLEVMPKRSFSKPEELKEHLESLGGVETLLIDVTEREYFRHQDADKRDPLFSGKKKRFTVKNTVISTLKKVIVFLGLTTQGSFHDYALLKEEFPPELGWFDYLKILVDLGYLGIKKEYAGQIEIPHKKPRKSEANPDPQLTEEQKAENTAISKIRIFVENAISGIKRYGILVQKFRNKKHYFEDDVIAVAAGLWNLRIL